MKHKGGDETTEPRLAPPYMVYGALVLGLATAIAFRAILIFSYIQPAWVRPVWYFAVLGNFVFFLYRFRITEKRKRTINRYRLIERIESGTVLSPTERHVLIYLLRSIKQSPENINYLIIFIFSLIAIAADLLLAFFQPG